MQEIRNKRINKAVATPYEQRKKKKIHEIKTHEGKGKINGAKDHF